ncbi:glycosyltransferase family 39 protein, partial [bacterium]|nr:glycosyltransferase family 39 protein [bacterium]
MKRISLVLILVAAALIRLLHLHSIWDTPLVTTPIIDSEFYHFWAKALATGQGGDSSVFFMSPLYPYLLSVIYRIFAVDPHYVLMVQFLGGILLVYLIYSLARELFSEKIALTSALIAALYQPFIYYEGVLLSANLILLLNAAFLLILVRKQEMGWLNLFAGILMGLSALARPNILLFAFLLIVYL